MRPTSLLAAVSVVVLSLSGCAGVESSNSVQQEVTGGDCTYTQGYWKNHPDAWPVSSLTLGSVTYSKAQLLAIFRQPVKGNGLISLSHQLIAARLNLANGAASGSISASISDADAQIGGLVVPPIGSGFLATSATSAGTTALDDFNNGKTGPGHCDSTPIPPPPPPPVCGNGMVESGEVCDDGNMTAGDGCSAQCAVELLPPPPVCGNGMLEAGEACDDGNNVSFDGCSGICTLQSIPPPACGNGVLEGGEDCDDGNRVGGDGCTATCIYEPVSPPPPPVCGDGVLASTEHCDDGNLVSGDGCSDVCECD